MKKFDDFELIANEYVALNARKFEEDALKNPDNRLLIQSAVDAGATITIELLRQYHDWLSE